MSVNHQQLPSSSFAPRMSSGGDDDLFLMDADLLMFKEDVQQTQQSQHHVHSSSHNSNCIGASTSTAMDTFDHVDSLLLGFELDAPLDHSPFDNSFSALTGSGNHNGLALHRAERSFDGSASPTTTDDMSGSEMSSPPPSFDVSPASSPVRLAPALTSRNATASPGVASNNNAYPNAAVRISPAVTSAMNTFAVASALPYALPVAYYPNQPTAVALNANQKRPFQPDVQSTSPPAATTDATSGSLSDAKKSKREIRQMKNRESANKSRLRRKAQMSELADEVTELTKKQHALENTIAALRAENKSLHDQNAFLRSLVTTPGSVAPPLPQPVQSQQIQQLAAMPPSSDASASSLSAMENGQPTLECAPQKKLKTSRATTFSAASLSLCASVFGVTLLSDYDGSGAGQASHIRGTGRVLHSLPAVADAGFSPVPTTSIADTITDMVAGVWTFVSSSELAFGVFLNVLSFVVIMGLVHTWQSSFTMPTLPTPSAVHRRWTARSRANGPTASRKELVKRCSVSWQDIRLRDAAVDGSSGGDAKSRESKRVAPPVRALL